MCLFYFAIQPPSSEYVFIAANNRDTFFNKETASADFWVEHPNILAGRDMVGGGTWMGITRDGRFATLTNIPSPYYKTRNTKTRSRGLLVSDYLQGSCYQSPIDYCRSILSHSKLYSSFNLLTVRLRESRIEAAYCNNSHDEAAYTLKPDIYGLSNQILNFPVKKVSNGRLRFAGIISGLEKECERQLIDFLCDDASLYPDSNYPVLDYPDIALKHITSVFVPPFVLHGQLFGTRTNTVVMVTASGEVTYIERTRAWPVDLDNPKWETKKFIFSLTRHN